MHCFVAVEFYKHCANSVGAGIVASFLSKLPFVSDSLAFWTVISSGLGLGGECRDVFLSDFFEIPKF